MSTNAEKKFIHSLYERYYGENKVKQNRNLCIRCGLPRVLGKRGDGKGKCKKCRKE